MTSEQLSQRVTDAFQGAVPFESESTLSELLKHMGNNLVFVEVGVLRATTIVGVAEDCENVAKVIGVDNYLPYVDRTTTAYSVGKELAAMNKEIALTKIAASKAKDKIELWLEDSATAAHKIANGSIDCVFLDAYLCKEDVAVHVNTWRPKVKPGGVLCGHDIGAQPILEGLQETGILYSTIGDHIWISVVE